MAQTTPVRCHVRQNLDNNTTTGQYNICAFQGTIYCGSSLMGTHSSGTQVVNTRFTHGLSDPDGLGKIKFQSVRTSTGGTVPSMEYFAAGIRRITANLNAGITWNTQTTQGFISYNSNYTSAVTVGVTSYGIRCGAPGTGAGQTSINTTSYMFSNGWTVQALVGTSGIGVGLYKNGVLQTSGNIDLPTAGDTLAIELVMTGLGTVASPSVYTVWLNGEQILTHSDSSDQYASNTYIHIYDEEAAGVAASGNIDGIFFTDVPSSPGAIAIGSLPTYLPSSNLARNSAGELLPIYLRWSQSNQGAGQTPTSVRIALQSGQGSTSSPAVIRELTSTNIANRFYDPTNLYLTSDGTSTGSPRSGQYRLRTQLISTGGLAPYTLTSDGSGTAPTGTTHNWAPGYGVAMTTIASVVTPPSTLGYGDTTTTGITLAARPWHLDMARPIYTTTQSGLAADGGVAGQTLTSTTNYASDGSHTSANLTFDNNYRAADAGVTLAITFPTDSTRNSDRVMVLSSGGTYTDLFTVDPRISFTHLHQVNDNDFGTPPTSKEAGTKRLTSQLSFLSGRVTDRDGVGLNGISWTVKLWDNGNLISSEASPNATLSTTSTTQGGEAGWGGSFLTWSAGLPGGQWNKKNTITAPSTATGLESSNTTNYTLIAADPNLILLVGAGPTTNAKHFTPGTPLICLVGAFNITSSKRIALDSGTAKVAIARVNLTTQVIEYLASDGVTWTTVDDAASVYYHPTIPLAGDSSVYYTVFTNTASWGTEDIVLVGKAEVGGVPLSAQAKEIVVGDINSHGGYSFDAVGIFK